MLNRKKNTTELISLNNSVVVEQTIQQTNITQNLNPACCIKLEATKIDSTVSTWQIDECILLDFDGLPELQVVPVGLNNGVSQGGAFADFAISYNTLPLTFDSALGEVTFTENTTVLINCTTSFSRKDGTGERIYTAYLMKNGSPMHLGCSSVELSGIEPHGMGCQCVMSFNSGDTFGLGFSFNSPNASNKPSLYLGSIHITLLSVN